MGGQAHAEEHWMVGGRRVFRLARCRRCANAAAFGGRTPFDGTYRPVSSALVNTTYTTRKGQTGPCPNRRAGPLHILNGQAHYTTATGYRVRGTVGPQGELAMRAIGPSSWANQPIDLSVSGTVDGAGTPRVPQLSHSCTY